MDGEMTCLAGPSETTHPTTVANAADVKLISVVNIIIIIIF